MEPTHQILRTFLKKELDARKAKNSRYSVRSFAQFLEIDHSTLSQVLSGKRSPPLALITAIESKLGIILKENEAIVDDDINFLSSREFQVISSWEHFAMIDLVTVKDFRPDFTWMAAQLGIPEVEAKLVMERLLGLGFLRREQDGYVRTTKIISNDLPSRQTNAAKKEYQRQLIRKALSAIDSCPSDKKDITSISMAVDPKRLDVARERIKHFRRELCAYLEGGDRTEVYHMTIQLCPARTEEKVVS